jgi:hypothetical protein
MAHAIMVGSLQEYAAENMPPDDYTHAVENQPQSHEFFAEDFYDGGDYPDEDIVRAIGDVMDGDVLRQLHYWSQVVNGIKRASGEYDNES